MLVGNFLPHLHLFFNNFTAMTIQEISLETVWQIRHQVMWPERDASFVRIPEDTDAKHLGVVVDGQCVSIISLFKTPDDLQFRKFATLVSAQGKGYGSALLAHVIQSNPHQTIWCHARVEKQAYYEKFGFVGRDMPFEKNGKIYVRMTLEA
jgi:predicted GNAT family N-acyltransferase